MSISDLFAIETHPGRTINQHDMRLTPFATTFRLKLPFPPTAQLIWTRPTSILISSVDGRESTLAIPDITLRILLSIAAACLALGLIAIRSDNLFRRRFPYG